LNLVLSDDDNYWKKQSKKASKVRKVKEKKRKEKKKNVEYQNRPINQSINQFP